MKKLILFLMLLFSVFSLAQTTKTFYTCPMHPEVISSKPGDCPKCKMMLMKKTVIIKPKVIAKPQEKSILKTEKKSTEAKNKVEKKIDIKNKKNINTDKKSRADKFDLNSNNKFQYNTVSKPKPQSELQSQKNILARCIRRLFQISRIDVQNAEWTWLKQRMILNQRLNLRFKQQLLF